VSVALELVPDTPVVDDDVRARLNQLAGVVSGALGNAKTLTETEVLAAGNTLQSILGESQAQLEESNRLSREFGGGAESSDSLATVAGRLLDVLSDTPKLLDGVAKQVDLLATTAQKAQADTRKILALVSTVKRISASTKLLALNTRIEASRLGANEKALAVLSAEMRSLSDEVTGATELMESLAESLTENLPSVATGATRLVQTCVEQARGVTSSVQPFHAAYGRARRSVEDCLTGSRDRLERIQGMYTTILQNLQFQDRAQQQMQFAENAALALAAAMAEIIGLAEQAGPRSELAVAILERCTTAMASVQQGPPPPDAPSESDGEIQFL
jgi:methyl-accepting chemotaxis protein